MVHNEPNGGGLLPNHLTSDVARCLKKPRPLVLTFSDAAQSLTMFDYASMFRRNLLDFLQYLLFFCFALFAAQEVAKKFFEKQQVEKSLGKTPLSP